MHRSLLPFFSLFVILFPALANEALPLYSRTRITIERAKPPEGQAAAIALDTEQRDAEHATRMPGWFTFNTPGAKQAVLLMYTAPVKLALGPTHQFASLDILFVDEYGTIMQIAPHIVPANIDEPLQPDVPVLALLYLQGGAAEHLGIGPGDRVNSPLFRKKPALLGAPEKTSAPAAP